MNRRLRILINCALLVACLAGFYVAAQVSFTGADFKEGQVVSASAFNDLLNANFDAAGAALEALDEAKQARVSESCPADTAIRAIAADGSVSCQDSGGFSLPFSGTVSDGPPAFSITYQGGGLGMAVSSGGFGISVTASHIGLDMPATGGTSIRVRNAGAQGTYGAHGVVVEKARNSGFVAEDVGQHGLSVLDADQHGVMIDSAGKSGVLVSEAAENGLHVGAVNQNGVRIDSALGSALYVSSSLASGLYVGSANTGVNVEAADVYGGRFRGDVAGLVSMGATDSTPDLILAGNGAGSAAGRLRSDPQYSGSDLYLTSNNDVIVELDADANDSSHFLVVSGLGENVLAMAENGNLTIAGSLAENSDAAAKTVHAPVDAVAVLESLSELPLSFWSYLDDPEVRHIGPMAQDFSAAFGVGADETSISTIDRDGVAFAAIQGLNQLVRAQQATIAALEQRVAQLESGD